jgi:hypothetical protein
MVGLAILNSRANVAAAFARIAEPSHLHGGHRSP